MSQGESIRALPSALRSLPQQWELTRLRYLSSIRYGLGQPPREMPDGLPLIRATNVKRGRIVRENLVYVDPSDVPPGRDATLRDGDIVVVRSGAYTGDSALVTKEYDGAITGYDMVVRPTRVNSRFLAYTLLSTPVLNDQIDLCRLRAAQPHLNAKELGDTWVAVPPADEQRAIADYLDEKTATIDALIAKRERHIELLEEKRYAVISDLVAHGLDQVPLRSAGLPLPLQIPQHWAVQKLKHLTSFVTSGSRGWAEYYADDGPLFLRIGNLRRGSIELDLSDLQHVSPPSGAEGARTRVCCGDVLISITAFIGSVGWVPERGIDAYVNQHIALVRPTPTKVHSKWLAYMLLADAGQAMLRLPVAGGAKEGLGLDDIRDLPVFVPPMEEQAKIVEHIERTDQWCMRLRTRIEDQIAKLREYRQALISSAVTGRIPVREEVPA